MRSITKLIVLLAATLFQLSFPSYGGPPLVEAISRARVSAESAARQAKIAPRQSATVDLERKALQNTQYAESLAQRTLHRESMRVELGELEKSLQELLTVSRRFQDSHLYQTKQSNAFDYIFQAADVVDADAEQLRVEKSNPDELQKQDVRDHGDGNQEKQEKDDGDDDN